LIFNKTILNYSTSCPFGTLIMQRGIEYCDKQVSQEKNFGHRVPIHLFIVTLWLSTWLWSKSYKYQLFQKLLLQSTLDLSGVLSKNNHEVCGCNPRSRCHFR